MSRPYKNSKEKNRLSSSIRSKRECIERAKRNIKKYQEEYDNNPDPSKDDFGLNVWKNALAIHERDLARLMTYKTEVLGIKPHKPKDQLTKLLKHEPPLTKASPNMPNETPAPDAVMILINKDDIAIITHALLCRQAHCNAHQRRYNDKAVKDVMDQEAAHARRVRILIRDQIK